MAAKKTAYDLLMETEHLFSETHWASGQFFRMEGYKPTMCAMGGIRLVMVGGLAHFDDLLAEEKADLKGRYSDEELATLEEWWAPARTPSQLSSEIEDTSRFWNDAEYIRSLYCLMTAVGEQDGVDPDLSEQAEDYGRSGYTSLDYYQDTDDILSTAEEAIFSWNDSGERRTEEVVAAFKRAAQLANDKSFAPIPVRA